MCNDRTVTKTGRLQNRWKGNSCPKTLASTAAASLARPLSQWPPHSSACWLPLKARNPATRMATTRRQSYLRNRTSAHRFLRSKNIDAGLLNIAYAEAGPTDGRVVVSSRIGWPYDIHSYVDVAPILAAAGYRVIVPYTRGFGPTRFLSDQTFRNGEQVVFAVDIIALMDALKIQSCDL